MLKDLQEQMWLRYLIVKGYFFAQFDSVNID